MTVLSEDTLHIQKKTWDREKHVPMETVARRNVPRTGRNLQQNQTQWDPGGRRETGEGKIRGRWKHREDRGSGEQKQQDPGRAMEKVVDPAAGPGPSRVGLGDPATDSGKY